MSDEAAELDPWDAWELGEDEREQERLTQLRLDTIRIRACSIVLCERAARAKADLAKAVASVERARKKAERELARCAAACELAERMATFAARVMAGDVDPSVRREAASAIEELFG